jgi:catechol 2,3-dioxygenase-like lactoylglutathione lyase family enzyme
MAATVAADVVKFHLSLNSSNLHKSIAFYRVLFGVEPAKVRDDYAKFEVPEPPLIMSLAPVAPTPGGTLNHVGLRVTDSEQLVAMQARLEQAGYATEREEGVECCYSKQTKFWVTDPDRTLWELYILHGDADEDDHGPSATHGVAGNSILRTEGLKLPILQPAAAASPASAQQAAVVWAHLLTQPLPSQIDQADASVDEVQLHGTFNMAVDGEALATFLADARRVLRPGGTISAHMLTSAGGTLERPKLPGPAALVERVLPSGDVVAAICAAGFVGVRFTKLAEKPCFNVEGTDLRETKISATKAAAAGEASACGAAPAAVVYKGPLRQLVDDFGTVYARGVPTPITAEAWALLQATGATEQFVAFGSEAKSGDCCS